MYLYDCLCLSVYVFVDTHSVYMCLPVYVNVCVYGCGYVFYSCVHVCLCITVPEASCQDCLDACS